MSITQIASQTKQLALNAAIEACEDMKEEMTPYLKPSLEITMQPLLYGYFLL